MKKKFLLIILLFVSASLFSKDYFGIFGFQNSLHVETGLIEDSISATLISPSSGLYFSGNYFNEKDYFGLGFSNTFSIVLVPDELYFSNRFLIGYSTRFYNETTKAAVVSGIILQPELEFAKNDYSSFHFLIGLGLDFEIGAKQFGSTLNVSAYPLTLQTITHNGETRTLNIEYYGRICVGITFGASYTNF